MELKIKRTVIDVTRETHQKLKIFSVIKQKPVREIVDGALDGFISQEMKNTAVQAVFDNLSKETSKNP